MSNSNESSTELAPKSERCHKAVKIMNSISMFIVFIVMVVQSSRFLNYLLVPISNDELHCAMTQASEVLGDIDVAIFGSSDTLTGMNTKVISENSDFVWYNVSRHAGRASQSEIDLELFYKYNNPKYVIYEVNPSRLFSLFFPLVRTSGLDYTRIDGVPLLFKDIYLNGLTSVVSSILPFTKHISKIGDAGYVKNNVKGNIDFSDNEAVMEVINNHGLFQNIKTEAAIARGNYGKWNFKHPSLSVNSYELRALKRSVEFIKSKGSEVILVDTIKPYFTKNISNRVNINNYFNSLAAELDVEYYDFGLLKYHAFNRHPNGEQYFIDITHMTGYGAEAFAPVMARFFQDVIIDGVPRGDYFLNNANDIYDDAPIIFSASLGYRSGKFNATVNKGNEVKDGDVLYKWSFRYGSGEWVTVADYSNSSTLPASALLAAAKKDGKVEVRVETKQSKDIELDFEQYAKYTVNIKKGSIR